MARERLFNSSGEILQRKCSLVEIPQEWCAPIGMARVLVISTAGLASQLEGGPPPPPPPPPPPSRTKRNARRLQAFLDKKRDGHPASQKELEPAVRADIGVQTEECVELKSESEGSGSLCDDSEYDEGDEPVKLQKCDDVSFEMREGQPGVKFSQDGVENWTPVRSRRRKFRKNDEEELFIPGGATAVYCESKGTPGLSVKTRRTRSWHPIASRTRGRLKT